MILDAHTKGRPPGAAEWSLGPGALVFLWAWAGPPWPTFDVSHPVATLPPGAAEGLSSFTPGTLLPLGLCSSGAQWYLPSSSVLCLLPQQNGEDSHLWAVGPVLSSHYCRIWTQDRMATSTSLSPTKVQFPGTLGPWEEVRDIC